MAGRLIVHVSDCYLPRLGGIEVQVRQLAMRQAAEGHDVHVITGTPGSGEVRGGVEVLDGVTVHRVAANIPFDLPVHPRTAHHVLAVIDRLGADALDRVVVHVHAGVVSPFAWSGLRATAGRGLPTLVTVHSVWGPLAQPGFRVLDGLVRWSRLGVQLAAVSEVAAARIRSVVGGSTPVLVTPNGVDPSMWRVSPVAHPPSEVHAVSVMRLAPRKRALPLLDIVEAASAAVPADVRLRLTVVGDGPDRARVERRIRDRGLDVSLPGRLTHEQIRSLYATADLFVQPSVKESFGLAALEARTAGLPVVARRETGITEFVRDGAEGLLAGSDDEMAAAVARLATEVGLRGAIAAHNRAVEPEQVWPRVLETVDLAYAAAAARRRAAPPGA